MNTLIDGAQRETASTTARRKMLLQKLSLLLDYYYGVCREIKNSYKMTFETLLQCAIFQI